MTRQISNYPSAFYRVSLKAVIKNKQGRVLVVKTTDSAFAPMWDLPGGGMEHGDDEKTTLTKELNEEACIITPIISFRYLGMTPRYTRLKQAWWLNIFYEVTLPDDFSYGIGAEGAEVAFIDPHTFEGSLNVTEQLIYTWATISSIE